jgi:hypothetical protein
MMKSGDLFALDVTLDRPVLSILRSTSRARLEPTNMLFLTKRAYFKHEIAPTQTSDILSQRAAQTAH